MNEFFTWATFGSLVGATAGVVLVTSVVRKLLNFDSLWVPFVVSIIVAAALSYTAGTLLSLSGGVLAFLNSCLLFCSALGMNDTVVTAKPTQGDGVQEHGARDVRLVQPWLRRQWR